MRALSRIGDVPSAAVLRERRPCWRKVPHRSLGAAEVHLRALRKHPLVRNAHTLCAYGPCRWCGGFHVGHDRSEQQ